MTACLAIGGGVAEMSFFFGGVDVGILFGLKGCD